MTNVQVRDVPPEAVERLKRLAARKGQSLQGYLRNVLLAQADVQVLDDILDGAAARTGGYRAAEGESVEEVRRAREERDKSLPIEQ
jgi:plasmid stability protein